MKTLDPRSFGALTLLRRYGTYLLARLESNPALAAVADTAQGMHDRLNSALLDFWSAQNEAMGAMSTRDARKYQLDAALRTLRTAVLVSTYNDRQSTLYRVVFPDGFSTVIRLNATDALARARNILQTLSEFRNPVLDPAAEGLRGAIEALSDSLTELNTAQLREQAASGALAAARQSYCTQYERIFHRIVLILGERRRAETYFRREPRASRAKVPASSAVEPASSPQGDADPREALQSALASDKSAGVAAPAPVPAICKAAPSAVSQVRKAAPSPALESSPAVASVPQSSPAAVPVPAASPEVLTPESTPCATGLRRLSRAWRPFFAAGLPGLGFRRVWNIPARVPGEHSHRHEHSWSSGARMRF